MFQYFFTYSNNYIAKLFGFSRLCLLRSIVNEPYFLMLPAWNLRITQYPFSRHKHMFSLTNNNVSITLHYQTWRKPRARVDRARRWIRQRKESETRTLWQKLLLHFQKKMYHLFLDPKSVFLSLSIPPPSL